MHTKPNISPLFPPGTSSEAVVKMTIFMLKAKSGEVAKALAGIDELYIKRLVALFDELLARSDSPRDALATLTKIIAADLDGEGNKQ